MTTRRTLPSLPKRAWVVFAIACLLVVTVVAVLQRAHRARWDAYMAAEQAAIDAHIEAVAKWRKEESAPDGTRLLYTKLDGRPHLRAATREELKARLFPGRKPGPVAYTPALRGEARSAVAWDDPRRGLIFAVTFRDDGTWSTMSLLQRPLGAPRPPARHPILAFFDPLRRAWVGSFTGWTIGPVVWAVLFVASLLPTRRALQLAHGQLAVAVLCFVGWLVNPNYTVSLKGITSNDMLFWGTLMVMVAAVALRIVVVRSRRPLDPRFCARCGYDLTGNVSGVCPECGQGRTAVAPA